MLLEISVFPHSFETYDMLFQRIISGTTTLITDDVV